MTTRALALASLCVAGCSVFTLHNTPEHPTSEPTCSASPLPPSVDLAISILAGLRGALLIAVEEGEGNVGHYEIPQSAGLMVGFGLSAWVGFERMGSCAAARHAWRMRPQVPTPTPFAPFVEHVPASDPEAARLTHEAHAAAVERRCSPTAAHGPRVHYLDPEYYDKVFLVDDAIARCR